MLPPKPRASLKKNGRVPSCRAARIWSAWTPGAIRFRSHESHPCTERIFHNIRPLPRCSSYCRRSMPSRRPKVRPTCSMVSIDGMALPMYRSYWVGRASRRKPFCRPILQPLVHHKELIIAIGIRLRFRRDSALIESRNYLPDFIDPKSNQPIAQVAERFALGCVGKLISLKNRASVDSRVYIVNGDADWNLFQQRPLWAAHATNFRQQCEVDVEHAETRYIQQGLAQDITACENDQVG